MVFVMKSMSTARRVVVNGKPLGAAAANETKSGWYRAEGGVAVRILDDGRPYEIDIQ
jgi:hypothetical protein